MSAPGEELSQFDISTEVTPQTSSYFIAIESKQISACAKYYA